MHTHFPLLALRARVAFKILVLTRPEVILLACAIDSPKLLLLYGVGPAKDLQYHVILIPKDLLGIGQICNDRLLLELVTTQKPGSHHRTSYINSPDSLQEVRKQWTNHRTGPLADWFLPQMIGHFESHRIPDSEEF